MKYVFVLLSAVVISGCALFAPKNFSKYSQGEWQGKVLIKDKKEKRSGLVNVKVRAIDNQSLRLDVTSPVGTHVASVLMDGENIHYLSVSEKTVYKSKANRDSLRGIFKIPIEPKLLYNVFFDRPIEAKTWSCVSDTRGLLQECKDRQTGLNIRWTSREGAKRTVAIEHAAASLQINLYDFVKEIKDPATAFVLPAPSSFRVKNL
jgi:hypothetical protein